MANINRLTAVEWEIMETVWKLGESPSVREVLEYAFPNGEKAYTTVQTIMNNLEHKGLLERRKIGLVNFYTPTKSRDAMVKEETSHLVRKVFRGSFPALANFLVSSESLTPQEIAWVKKLIQEKEKQLGEIEK